jgi:hypothetical protein
VRARPRFEHPHGERLTGAAAGDDIRPYGFTRTDRGIAIAVLVLCLAGFLNGNAFANVTVPPLVAAAVFLYHEIVAAVSVQHERTEEWMSR